MTLLSHVVEASARIARSASRLAKIREMAACLRAVDADEIEPAVRYLSGGTRQGRIGVGYSMLRQAQGAAADEPSLSIRDVDAALDALAAMRGAGSSERRSAALRELYARATRAEQDFLTRLIIGELRQGALAGVMVDAIAAFAGVEVAHVRRAAMYASDLGVVARVLLTEGVAALGRFQMQPLSPVAPMLAQTAADVTEALETLKGEIAFEWKLDGARIQAHKVGELVRIYTRSLNEVTHAIPEVVEVVRALPAREVILDGEAIAYDPAERPYPFQTTMRRFGRKLDVDRLRSELPMRAFFFDCLRLEGESLADRPLRERNAALARAIPPTLQIPRLVTSSASEARAFYAAAIEAGHEGLMAKALDSPYEAGNRRASWLKIKRAHTLDLVILAAEWGHGRRKGWLSNLHLGALDPESGEYVMLGKTFKGLTDAMLEQQTRELLARETHRDEWTVYVRPELVVEVAFSDLQESPRYPGGVALRLARVKRQRTDKRPEEADTMESVRRIFAAQRGSAGPQDS